MGLPDEIDMKIISILSKNARIPVSEIARTIGLSRVATSERLNKLVESKVIQEFVAIIDSRAIGYDINVFLEIEITPHLLLPISEQLAAMPQVSIVYQMTGSTSLHVHAYARDTEDLAAFLRDKIYTIKGVIKVNSSLLLNRFKSVLSMR